MLVSRSSKQQSAMEYLMTYGWAILIVAVVLAALFQLGVFNSSNYTETVCIAQSGYTCAQPVMNTSGYLQVNFGQVGAGSLNVTGIACANSTGTPASFTNFSTAVSYFADQVNSTVFKCQLGQTGVLGATFQGYLWIKYTNPATGATLEQPVAVIKAVASTQAPLAQSPVTVIVCVGGNGADTAVYYATVKNGGTITSTGGWHATTTYPVAFLNGGCLIYNDYIYCTPSQSSGDEHVYYAPVSTSGVGSWTQGSLIPPGDQAMAFGGCTAAGGYMYCAGSYGCGPGDANVFVAQIQGSGALGSFTDAANHTTAGMCGNPDFAYKGYLDVIQSVSTTVDDYAQISSGTVHTFQTTTSYPGSSSGSGFEGACEVYNNNMWCIGGRANPTGVYNAIITNGQIGTFTTDPSYPVSTYQNGCIVDSGVIYCIGSESGSYMQVYDAPVSSSGIGAWVADASYPVQADATACAATSDSGAYSGGGGSTTN